MQIYCLNQDDHVKSKNNFWNVKLEYQKQITFGMTNWNVKQTRAEYKDLTHQTNSPT